MIRHYLLPVVLGFVISAAILFTSQLMPDGLQAPTAIAVIVFVVVLLVYSWRTREDE